MGDLYWGSPIFVNPNLRTSPKPRVLESLASGQRLRGLGWGVGFKVGMFPLRLTAVGIIAPPHYNPY